MLIVDQERDGAIETAAGDDVTQDAGGPPPDDPAPRSLDARDRRLVKRATAAGLAAGFFPFLCVLWDFALWPLRMAGAHGFASNFYDIQARALFHGHLSVPEQSIGIEGFVIDGRTYMYYPPFPALLRMPVLLITDRLDGKLTAPSMMIAWVVLAAAAATLVWNVRLLVRGTEPVSRLEAVIYAILLAAITGGSVVVFLASLPWVYHEVYLWATAFAVTTFAGLTGLARQRSVGWTAISVVGALGAILTRTTTGWAMSLTLVVAGVVMYVAARQAARTAAILVAGGVLALLVGSVVNWAKFRHPYMFPLEHQEWTRLNNRRRLALMLNGGSITGPEFISSSLVNYFRPDGIRFVPYFPFVTLPAEPARSYGGAFLDQMYRTGSVPTFSPLLFLLGVWGAVSAVRMRISKRVRGLLIPLAGAALIAGPVMMYGYVAYRYTSEFLPVMIIGSVIATVDIAARLARRSRRQRQVAVAAIAAAAMFGAVANAAAGVAAARVTWRGEPLRQYVALQVESARRTGRIDELVVQSDSLPADGPADQLHIVGDCDGLYFATGDQYEPWVAVEVREVRVTIEARPFGFNAGLLPLIRIDGLHPRDVTLESDTEGRVRFRVGEGQFYYPTEWYELEPGERIDVAARIDTSLDRFNLVFDGVAEPDWHVKAAETDGNQIMTVALPHLLFPPSTDQLTLGLRLTPSFGAPLELCTRLLDDIR